MSLTQCLPNCKGNHSSNQKLVRIDYLVIKNYPAAKVVRVKAKVCIYIYTDVEF